MPGWGRDLAQDRVEARVRELGRDAAVVERRGQELPLDGGPVGAVVAAATRLRLEVDRLEFAAAAVVTRGEDAAGTEVAFATLALRRERALVEDAELVALLDAAREVEVPGEDSREVIARDACSRCRRDPRLRRAGSMVTTPAIFFCSRRTSASSRQAFQDLPSFSEPVVLRRRDGVVERDRARRARSA